MSFIEVADAREWLRARSDQADLVLTDPPHLDNFGTALGHRLFVNSWMPLALAARKRYGTLVHSCGQSPTELQVYLSYAPDEIRIWPHEGGFHYHLSYGATFFNPINYDDKPFPLWENIISECVEPRALIFDPFCGRGEIPYAARELGCYYRGCDNNADSVAYCVNELNL